MYISKKQGSGATLDRLANVGLQFLLTTAEVLSEVTNISIRAFWWYSLFPGGELTIKLTKLAFVSGNCIHLMNVCHCRLLPNLPCADLAFQQNTKKLCRFREQTAQRRSQQWNRTLVSSILLKPDMKFPPYKARTWGEGRVKWKATPPAKAPRAHKTVHFTPLYCKHLLSFPLTHVIRALLIWLKM